MAPRSLLLLTLVLGSALARPAPPSSQQDFEQLVRSSLASLASRQKSVSPKVERSAIDSFISNVKQGPDIKSAKLIGQAFVDNEQAFASIGKNSNSGNSLNLPGFGNVLSDDDEAILFELLKPTNVIRNHQLSNVGVPLSAAVSNNRVNNIQKAPLLSNVGVPLPAFGGQSSSTGNTGSFGVPLPQVNNVGNSGQSFGVPLSAVSGAAPQQNTFSNTGSFGVALPPVSTQGQTNALYNSANVGVPLPSFSGNVATNNEVNSGSFGVALPAQTGQVSNKLNSNSGSVGVALPPVTANKPMTVADLLQGMNGVNGIKVFSLGDLEKSDVPFGDSDSDTDFLQQLRNAMISGNINFDQSAQPSGVGVALPSLTLQQNIDQVENQAGEAEINFGRQVDTVAGEAEAGVSAIDAIFADNAAAAGTAGADTVSADPFADDTAAADPFAAYDDPFALDDNTEFDYDNYPDLEPLPAQPPNVFRTKLSDIFFTKGQWIGTLIGGVIDIGSSISGGVSRLFGKDTEESSPEVVST